MDKWYDLPAKAEQKEQDTQVKTYQDICLDNIKTPQELKEHFLAVAQPLVQQYVDAALGYSELESTNKGAREEVWDLLKSLMLASSSKIDVELNSAEDVLKAVTDGKCTLEEGDALLAMYKKVVEINNPNGAVSGGGGIVVNILGSATPELDVVENQKLPEG